MGSEIQSVLYLLTCGLLCGFAALMVRRYRAMHVLKRLVSVSTTIPSYRSSLPRLRQELDRARRYMHPVTLVVLSPLTAPLSEPAGGPSQLIVFSLLGAVVRDAFRATDILAFEPTHNHYLLLMPESPKRQVGRAVQRVQDLAWSRAGVRLQAGMVEFPTDALTLKDLVSACRATIDGPSTERMPLAAASAPADDGRWVGAR